MSSLSRTPTNVNEVITPSISAVRQRLKNRPKRPTLDDALVTVDEVNEIYAIPQYLIDNPDYTESGAQAYIDAVNQFFVENASYFLKFTYTETLYYIQLFLVPHQMQGFELPTLQYEGVKLAFNIPKNAGILDQTPFGQKVKMYDKEGAINTFGRPQTKLRVLVC